MTLQSQTAENARTAARTSIYLAATLYCDGWSSPVKIRNISKSGALLEGAIVGNTGELVQLVRGELIADGLVAWSGEGRCGIKFCGIVDVTRWRTSPSNAEQQRVDEVVRLVKAGAVPLPVSPLADVSGTVDDRCRITADIRRAADLLLNLSEELASDFEVVSRHGRSLQGFDIALQLLEAVEETLGRREFEGDVARSGSLRRSADQAIHRC